MTDQAALEALTSLCGSSIRFFDLVEITYLSRKKRVFLAVGAAALFLVKKDWKRVVTGGELLYGSIARVAEDETNDLQLFIFLDKNFLLQQPAAVAAVWAAGAAAGEPLAVKSVDRLLLLQWLEVAYTADFALRRGRIGFFPLCKALRSSEISLAQNSQDSKKEIKPTPTILPFLKTQKVVYENYWFLVRSNFEERAGNDSTSRGGGGEGGGRTSGTLLDDRGVEVNVVISPTLHTFHLEMVGLETVKIAASKWKTALLESAFHSCLLRSQPYIKKMNLADDLAAWTGWQLWVKTATHHIICILLRRLYMPPMMDLCQDIAVIFRLSFEDQKDYKIRDLDFLQEAELAADSLTPVSQTNAWLKDILQAKLDALIYNIEDYKWFSQKLKLTPKWHLHAKTLLKSLLQLLYKEGVLANAELIEALGSKVPDVDDPMEVIRAIVASGEGLEIAEIELKLEGVKAAATSAKLRAAASATAAAVKSEEARKALAIKTDEEAEGRDHQQLTEEEEEQAVLQTGLEPKEIQAYHRWCMRIGKYLAFCIDEGGLLGPNFSLADLSAALRLDITPHARAKIMEVFSFLLHLRSKNMLLGWRSTEGLTNAKTLLRKQAYTFNEQVFIPLLECGFIAQLFAKGEESVYLEVLRMLLLNATSQALKLTLCKQILKASAAEKALQPINSSRSSAFEFLVPALIKVLSSNNEAAASNSTISLLHLNVAALVNMSAGNERVKELLLDNGVYQVIVFLYSLKEETLLLPCTQLCLNMTKTSAHRQALISSGAFNSLVDILMAQYTSYFFNKGKLLGAVVAVLGQLASERQACRDMIDKYPVLDCILFLFHAAATDLECKSRVLFALKQLCQNDWQVQQRVGKHCIRTLIKDLRESAQHTDYATSVLLLLQVLADFKPNCFHMKAADIQEALEYLLNHTKIDTLYTRVASLQERVVKQTLYDYFSA